MLPWESMKTILHRGNFSRNNSTIFGIFICLVSQIITVFIGLCQGNCLSNFVETLVECHKYLKETEFLPKSYSSKQLF